jgi:fatty-acyl-CoA synthase
VFTGYGMSETCPILSLAQLPTAALADPDAQAALRAKTGIPLPLVDLRVVDERSTSSPTTASRWARWWCAARG